MIGSTRPRILLAEDDHEMRAWLRLVLRRLHAEVVEAASGTELLELVAGNEPIDLVITDVRMPAPSGLQVVCMARTAGLRAPFLVVSAFPDRALRTSLRQVGAEFLAKPFEASELLAAVRRLTSIAPAPDAGLVP